MESDSDCFMATDCGNNGLVISPDLNPTWYQVVAFFIAIWGAYLVRTMFQTTMGLITFWTTRLTRSLNCILRENY